mgnify:CR=1 FL=1
MSVRPSGRDDRSVISYLRRAETNRRQRTTKAVYPALLIVKLPSYLQINDDERFSQVISESDEENEENDKNEESKPESKVKKMGFGPLVTKDALANFRNKKEGGGFGGGGGGSPPSSAPALDVKSSVPVKSPIPSPKPIRLVSFFLIQIALSTNFLSCCALQCARAGELCSQASILVL